MPREALVEGDGSIKVPSNLRSDKGKLLYPSVTIVFVDKDLPLAKFLTNNLKGTLNKASGGWYVLSIYKLSSIYDFVLLVNGKFRTPKVEALHRLIVWLNNYNKFNEITLLPLDSTNLTSNGWLAGFSDCDSNFLISFSKNNSNIANNIQLTYRLSQRQEYHRESPIGTNYFNILSYIATTFKAVCKPFERTHFKNKGTEVSYIEKGYLVTVKSLESRLLLIDYFTHYPLLSSKRLDYLNWVEALLRRVSEK